MSCKPLDDGLDPCRLAARTRDLAEDAGRRILRVYEAGFAVRRKDDDTPLTEADMAAHRALVAGLGILTPDCPVLSEESGEVPYVQRRYWRRYWLVDPLDGTRDFIKRNGQFTVNIALIEGHEPVIGVIHVPVSGETYFACRGQGAWKQDAPGADARRIRVRPASEVPVVIAGTGSRGGATLQRYLGRLGHHRLMCLGSSLKSCLVAEGKADLYARFGPTSEWDTAAAQCIVEEAGGRLTDLDLRPLRYNSEESLLNPHFLVFGDRRKDWVRYL